MIEDFLRDLSFCPSALADIWFKISWPTYLTYTPMIIGTKRIFSDLLIGMLQYSDITWASWRPENHGQLDRLVQQLTHKWIIKAPHYKGIHHSQRVSYAESVSLPWRHHGMLVNRPLYNDTSDDKYYVPGELSLPMNYDHDTMKRKEMYGLEWRTDYAPMAVIFSDLRSNEGNKYHDKTCVSA